MDLGEDGVKRRIVVLARRVQRRSDRAAREDGVCLISGRDRCLRTLGDDDKLATKRLELDRGDVDAGEVDATGRRFDEAQQRSHEARLPGPSASRESAPLAARDAQVDAVERERQIWRVAQTEAVDDEVAAARPRCRRRIAVGQLLLDVAEPAGSVRRIGATHSSTRSTEFMATSS